MPTSTVPMSYRIRSALVPTLMVLLPFLFRPERLLHPSPLCLALGVAIIYLTQPPYEKNIFSSPQDKRSAQLIVIMGIVATLAPVIEFLVRKEVRPPATSFVVPVGACVIALGIGFRVYSINLLGRHFTGAVKTTEDHELIQAGPYKYLRHPSYLGVLITLMGSAIMFESIATIIVTWLGMFPVYLYRIKVEEAALGAHFGSKYAEYQNRTKKLFPFVY